MLNSRYSNQRGQAVYVVKIGNVREKDLWLVRVTYGRFFIGNAILSARPEYPFQTFLMGSFQGLDIYDS